MVTAAVQRPSPLARLAMTPHAIVTTCSPSLCLAIASVTARSAPASRAPCLQAKSPFVRLASILAPAACTAAFAACVSIAATAAPAEPAISSSSLPGRLACERLARASSACATTVGAPCEVRQTIVSSIAPAARGSGLSAADTLCSASRAPGTACGTACFRVRARVRVRVRVGEG